MGMVNNFLNEVRHEFTCNGLEESSVAQHPIEQVEKWLEEAVASQIHEPNAMTITTVSADGIPSSRVVYARGIDHEGIKLYTNYHSKKGSEIEQNNNVALLFFYPELERQIRITGTIAKLSEEASDQYFNARPLESKLGAWASEQSNEIPSREHLTERLEYFRSKFGESVPRPPHWGGYIVHPTHFEFWQGRPARLHDRLIYTQENNQWKIHRVAP